MQKTASVFRFVAILATIFALAGLSAWYIFLKSHKATIQQDDAARGYGESAPSFSGRTGSTYDNVGSGISDTKDNTVASTSQKGRPPQLWQISKNPVAGMGFVRRDGVTSVYFVERATGYLYSANMEDGSVARLANTLTPKIYEAYFSQNGSMLTRSTDARGAIVTFASTLPTSTRATTNTSTSSLRLAGTTLERNIISVAVNPSSAELFYIIADPNSGPVGIQAAWNNSKQKRVFSSPLADWRTQWLLDGRIILTQSAADNVPGYAYELKPDGSLSTIARNTLGLTVLARSSSPALLIGSSAYGVLSLSAAADRNTPPIQLPIKTVAEKCVWSRGKELVAYCAVPRSLPSGDFLNNWYRGAIHTQDSWWRVTVKDGDAKMIFSPSVGSLPLDVERPMMDLNGTYITFINAADKSLWLLRLDTPPTPHTNK